MHKLAELEESDLPGKVFVWRKILTDMWREGFEAGYVAARRDRQFVETVTDVREHYARLAGEGSDVDA
ncbi:MAG: hypothetical protein JWO11_4317 [Nocardioides sp.]|nr:hypothetical protein [Nocardioides sp.]